MNSVAEISLSVAASDGRGRCTSRVLAQITPAVYADLRRLAHCFMRGERCNHTLQPTAVVNEAFVRLSRTDIHAKDAPHLFRLVAQTMRRVLVDHARERKRIKRMTLPLLENADASAEHLQPWASGASLDVLDIDAALDELSKNAPRCAALLELRYFAGLQDAEIGELYGISRPTIEREFRFAKAFLVAYGRRRRSPSAQVRSADPCRPTPA